MPQSQILRGRENICRYLDNMNKNSFYKWIKRGMPAHKEKNLEWVSHSRALDDFFYNLSISDKKQKKDLSSP